MAGKLTGILLVDKPAGWTSHDVVGKLRRITGERRIGHSGTLDPLATGLLVVFIGRATRAVEFAEADSKEYIAGLRLGVSTDTQDVTGTVLSRCATDVTRARLEETLPRFRGEQEQIPPMYSAIKRDGKKLYELARRGEEVDRPARRINITKLECIGEAEGDFLLEVECSKGTYIRTLCADLGDALGCGACMSSLRRTRAGGFRIEDAHTLEELAEGTERFLLPVDCLFSEFPPLTVDAKQETRVRVGGEFAADAPEGDYRVYAQDGEFLALYRVSGGAAVVIKNFFEV